MSCLPTYKEKRYNSLEELYKANGISEQQKQEAQQLYSQYLKQNPNGSIEQFKSWVEEFNNLQEDDFTNLNVFNFAEVNLEEAKKIITNSFINATQEEAKLIYRKFAIQYHPDKGGSEELMKHLNDVNDKFKNGKLNKEKENINKQAVRKFYEEIKNNLEKHREGKTILGKTYNSNTFEYKNDIKLTSQDFIGGILSNKGYFKVGNFIRYALQNPQLFDKDSLQILENLTKGQYYNSENNLANTSIYAGNPSEFSSVNSLGAVFVKKSSIKGYADISEIHINPAYFDIAFFENNLNNDKFKEFVNTLGHELVHKLTIPDLLSDNTTRKEIEEIYKAAKEAYKTYTGVKNNITDYALSNLAEFTANYFNSKEFKDFLKTVTVKSENNKKQSLLDKLISVIIKFFNKNYGITEKNAYDYLTKVINNNTFYGVPNKVFVRKADYKSSNYSIDNLSNFISQKSQERLNQIQEIFNQNPELSKIGTVKQYNSYLDTIFPDSKVKDIVYHGTDAQFDKFDKSFYQSGADYIYFGKLDTPGFKNLSRVIPAILNLKNPSSFIDNKINKVYNEDGFIEDYTPKFMETASEEGEFLNQYGVKEPEQIHILGSKKDIEKFKNWIGINNVLPSQKLLDNLQFKKGDC